MEGDAAGIPGQAAVVQDAPGLGLDILDHRLVLDLQHRARRQHPAPMLHQIEIHPVIAAELPQIVGIVDLIGEMLAEAGQAGVERVAAQMNDPRLGQDEMDEPDEHVVVGHLVGDPRRLGCQRPKALDIGFAAAAILLARKKGQAFGKMQGPAGLQAGGELAHVGKLAGAMDRGMAGQNLLHQGRARAREAEDEDRQLRRGALAAFLRDELSGDEMAHALESAPSRPLVIGDLAPAQPVRLQQIGEGLVMAAGPLIGMGEGEEQQAPAIGGRSSRRASASIAPTRGSSTATPFRETRAR